MAKYNGIMSDLDGDLLIQNGTFVVGDTEQVEVRRILLSAQGGYPWAPGLGVDLQNKLGMSLTGDERKKLVGRIRQQLQNDGFVVNEVSLSSTGLAKIDAER